MLHLTWLAEIRSKLNGKGVFLFTGPESGGAVHILSIARGA
jgi:hypothetical protein